MMNKNNDWRNNKRGGNNSSQRNGNNSGQRGKNWNKNGGSWKSRQNQNRNFEKFVDTDHRNYESNFRQQNNKHNNNHEINDHFFNEPTASGSGIYPWIRNWPTNHLVLPQHVKFDEQYEKTRQERVPNDKNYTQQKETESNERRSEPLNAVSTEISVPKNDNMEVTKTNSEVHQPLTSPVTSNTTIEIKQEKFLLTNLKQEKKSSSSSSSSSETSSSEEEPEPNIKAAMPVKPATSIPKEPSSPLVIKLKPRSDSVSVTPAKVIEKSKVLPENSSSSTSSDEEETPPPAPTTKTEKRRKPKILKKSESKNRSELEDEVVCVGRLDNKIVLEDETDNSSQDEEAQENKTTANIAKKSGKQTAEKCMICDKKGHTSFQCQMICKNCSAPYHGYRTCPHPANLNTMLQLFVEFCMQQLQNFQVEKQQVAIPEEPKPQIESSHLTNVGNKSSKLKRKQSSRTNETNKRHKKSKKRKLSASKKTNSKTDSDESSDEDKEDSADSETSSTETDEQTSDSSDKSLISSKKKRKLKTPKNTSKATRDLTSLAANSAGLPMVLNGFPQLAIPTASIQNPNASANALNTLLLTQMFQNAIGSLRK